jgi:hypothetical protein
VTDIGSWAWAQETGGRLSRRNQAELVRQGVVARLALLPGPWRRSLVRDGRSLRLSPQPDTTLAREAEQYVREWSSPVLHGHCLRTWAFADLFAQAQDVKHDEELLYVACLLHDLGLTEPHEGRDRTARCFAVEGARGAHALVCQHEGSEHKAELVAQAISLHLNIKVPDRFGPVATLLHQGVALDAVGRWAERLPAGALGAVNQLWPREGSGDELVAATRRQAQLRPRSRAALLHKLGFAGLVAANPLDRDGHEPAG